ncbi:M16 family metallopeptidase [Sphingopyxis sp. LARHCG72]
MMRDILLPIFAWAALSVSTMTSGQPFPSAPPIEDLKPFEIPASETFNLPNGLKVTLIPYGIAPKLLVNLRVDAGEVDAGNTTSLAKLAAEMLTEGASGRNAQQLAESAAAMGGDLRVTGNDRATNIFLNILSDHTTDAIMLIRDIAFAPDFPAAAFEKVKASHLRNLSVAFSDAGALADFALARTIYPGHPYGAVPDPARIQSYTLDQVKTFHRSHFTAGRAHLYLTGRFDIGAVRPVIEAAFGALPQGAAREAPAATYMRGPHVVLVDRPGASQSTLRLSFPVPLKSDADEAKLEVADSLLGGAFSSRITKNIRENKGYSYSPYSSLAFAPDTARWVQNADVTSAVTGASLHEIWSEIKMLQENSPSESETNSMKTYRAGLFTLRGSNPGGLLGLLLERDALGLPADWLEDYIPKVIAVTPDDIRAVAAKHFTVPTQTLVVVGDLKTIIPQLQAQPELKGAEFQTIAIP